MTTKEQNVRDQVSKDYAAAVTRPSPDSCCGTVEDRRKGVAVKSAGYTPEELASLPDDAVVNAFGCGNPTALAGVKEGDVVLDLGSGAGIDVLLAARKVGPTGRAIGIDMTDEMLAKANENIAASGLTNAEVRKGIIEDLPVADSSVDWVISNCVINLSPEKDKVFAEIARVLKPGGRMLVSDIVVTELPQWARENSQLYSSCVAGAISEEQYIQGLNDAGLEEVEVIDRVIYESNQLEAFINSELKGDSSENASSCCGTSFNGSGITPDMAKTIATEMSGKVWSAVFRARKS